MTELVKLSQPDSKHVHFDQEKQILTIDGLEIKDLRVIDLVRQKLESGEDIEALVLELLQIGAKAASVFSSNAGAETIKNAVENARDNIGSSITSVRESIATEMQTLTAEDGNLNQTITRVMDKFAADVTASISGEKAPVRTAIVESVENLQKALKLSIDASLENQKGDVARLLNPNDGTSTLGAFLLGHFESISRVLEDVQSKVTKEIIVKDALSNTTFGGLSFEQRVVSVFQDILRGTTDMCEATGETTGYERNNKKGDAVIEMPTGSGVKARIVVEVKDQNMRIKEWEAEAKGARLNRRAEGFIGVCRTVDQMPSEGQRVWIPDLKTVVVAFDPETDDNALIASLYKFVKISTMTRNSTIDEDSSEKLLQHLNEALKTVSDFNDAEKNISSIKIATTKLEGNLSRIRGNLQVSLESAQNVLLPPETQLDDEIEENEGESVQVDE